MDEKVKQEVREDIEILVRKYKAPTKINQIRMYKEFVGVIIPKYAKKYGTSELGEIFKEIKDELEKKESENNGVNKKTTI